MKRLSLSVMLSALVVAHGAHATEGGGSVYPTGAEGYLCCALPPPGLYALIYAELPRRRTAQQRRPQRRAARLQHHCLFGDATDRVGHTLHCRRVAGHACAASARHARRARGRAIAAADRCRRHDVRAGARLARHADAPHAARRRFLRAYGPVRQKRPPTSADTSGRSSRSRGSRMAAVPGRCSMQS